MTGTLITDLISTVEKAEKSHGPEFSHTHDCTQCGSVAFCDWADCGNEPTICSACMAWHEGR